MRRDLLDILACPICKAEFELAVDQENAEGIVSGTLTCTKCGERYPIVDSIPNLLPPELRGELGATMKEKPHG
ncbi:MAG TPA: methytransferase partner Trm112 [Dehalococcoidia bacterium]|nr:methytransferase partner Trm112 [Dehalococcoidia bacterium]